MAHPNKATVRHRDASSGKFLDEDSEIKQGIERLRKDGVTLEISPDGSLRVKPSSYKRYLKPTRDAAK